MTRAIARTAAGRGLAAAGALFDFTFRTLKALVVGVARGEFAVAETVRQSWQLAATTTGPALLAMIPFAAAITLVVGSVAAQIGAEAYSGAVVAFLIVAQTGPIVCCMTLAGAGSASIAADLGAAAVRDEPAVLSGLVVPRVVAAAAVGGLLNGIVTAFGIGVSLVVHITAIGGTPGGFLMTLSRFTYATDFVAAGVRAVAFGAFAALIAAHQGLLAQPDPTGVGGAVTRATTLSFQLAFVVTIAVDQLFPLLVPPAGQY